MIIGPNKIEQSVITMVLAITLAWIILLVVQRTFIYDQAERQIEIAFPEADLIAATLKDHSAPEQLLAAGVTTLVRQPYTLKKMMDYGLAEAWHVEPDLMHIYLEDNKLTGNATVFLTGQLGMNAVAMNLKSTGFLFEVRLPAPMEELDPERFILEISAGPMPKEFRRALYFPAGDWGITADLDQLTQSIYSLQPDVVIPDWLGGLNASYFYKSYLHTPWLRKPLVAIPEFGLPWQGRWAFRKQKTHRLIRIHHINALEMASLSPDQLQRRLMRAVLERSINMVYLEQSKNRSFQESLRLIQVFKQTLLEHHFTIGSASVPKLVRSGHIAINIIYLALTVLLFAFIWKVAIWAAGVTGKNAAVDKQLTIKLKPSNFRWTALFFLFGLLIIHWQGNMSWSTKGAALLMAIVVPLLSLAYLPEPRPLKNNYGRLFIQGLRDFGLISIWNIFAGLAIAILLYQPSFTLRIDLFWGVKLAFALPLLLGAIYLFPSITDKSWWQARFAPGHWQWSVAGLGAALLGLIYLILRSGNHSWLPIANFESSMRETLEQLMVARPRFKEFAIGHPILIIGLIGRYLSKNRAQVWSHACIALGMVGQLSIINTFCHIHTPMIISLWRTANGLLLGSIIAGLTFLPIYLITKKN